MMRRTSLLVLALLTGTLSMAPQAVAGDDPVTTARDRMHDDANGRIVVESDARGRVTFVGTRARAGIDNPGVGREESVERAARAHLDRYGAALGAARGSRFVQQQVARTGAGVDVVRFGQELSGVPVLGGELVLGIGRDRELRSLSSSVAHAGRITESTVSAREAERTARGVVARAHQRAELSVTDQGRWVLDPDVAHLTVPGGVRTVRKLEVGDGSGIRRMVLVDDHTGAIVANLNLIEEADRVVCDRNNVRAAETPCTSGFARTEASGPSGITDVENAFVLAGATSDFYQQIGGLDLTDLLGINVSGVKKLASTVRYCTTDLLDNCPYDNAFWNGQQMFYGAGFASADDVVGHEMTHGVVDQFSKLFYWGQSGAINESLADIIGEIIDHRRTGDDDSAWDLGEDLGLGALRSMSDPTIHGDPDRMTSANYTADDTNYGDNGGVHTNSGVGNKTAYLISQGGTFNGQTITGVDTGDATLTKTAKLYVDVIKSLPSGADYAALADQLEQSCADLQAAAAMTSANCAAVHQVTLATELRTNPTNALHDTDAPTTCPANTAKRVLFDSETGTPSAKFVPNAGWVRENAAGTTNATSGTESWYAEDVGTSTASSGNIHTYPLLLSAPVALPAGRQSYLSFENWYATDYFDTDYYDGGTVELGVDGAGPANAEGPGWVNGPDRTLATGFGNTGAGRPAYAGDSRGWSVSSLDLTSHAGHTVQPQFTMRTDNQFGFVGWYLDDIKIYTCDPLPGVPASVSGVGGVRQARISWTAPTLNPGGVTGYRIRASNGKVALVGAAARSVSITGLGTSGYSFEVRALGASGYQSAARSVTLAGTTTSLAATRSGSVVKLSGTLRRNGARFAGRTVILERKSGTSWIRVALVKTTAKGTFTKKYTRKAAATYRARFAGGTGVMGSASPQRRK